MDCTKAEQREKDLHPTTQKFTCLLETASNQSLNFVQLDEFTDAYKKVFNAFTNKNTGQRAPLAGSSKEAKKIRETFQKDVLSHLKEEIELCVDSEEVDRKFRELDEMKVEFQHLPELHKAWRPPGDAEVHMKPFNKFSKVKEREDLVRQVNLEREKLNILKSRVESKRKRTILLNDAIERKTAALEKEIVRGSKTDHP